METMISIGIGVISVCAIFVTFSPVYYFYKMKATRSEIDELKLKIRELNRELSQISEETQTAREQFRKEREALENAFNKKNHDN